MVFDVKLVLDELEAEKKISINENDNSFEVDGIKFDGADSIFRFAAKEKKNN